MSVQTSKSRVALPWPQPAKQLRHKLVQQIYHAATLPPNAMLAAMAEQMSEFQDLICASYQHS